MSRHEIALEQSGALKGGKRRRLWSVDAKSCPSSTPQGTQQNVERARWMTDHAMGPASEPHPQHGSHASTQASDVVPGVVPHPWGTRNPRVLGSSEPTPEEPLRRGGAQGGSGSNPPNWIPNSGVQGEPCAVRCCQLITSVWGRHVRLVRRVIALPYVLL